MAFNQAAEAYAGATRVLLSELLAAYPSGGPLAVPLARLSDQNSVFSQQLASSRSSALVSTLTTPLEGVQALTSALIEELALLERRMAERDHYVRKVGTLQSTGSDKLQSNREKLNSSMDAAAAQMRKCDARLGSFDRDASSLLTPTISQALNLIGNFHSEAAAGISNAIAAAKSAPAFASSTAAGTSSKDSGKEATPATAPAAVQTAVAKMPAATAAAPSKAAAPAAAAIVMPTASSAIPLVEVKRPRYELARADADFEPQETGDLRLRAQQLVLVCASQGQWWECAAQDGDLVTGVAPSNYLSKLTVQEALASGPQVEGEVIYDFSPADPKGQGEADSSGLLPVPRGARVRLIESMGSGANQPWRLAVASDGSVGVVPATYVRESPAQAPAPQAAAAAAAVPRKATAPPSSAAHVQPKRPGSTDAVAAQSTGSIAGARPASLLSAVSGFDKSGLRKTGR